MTIQEGSHLAHYEIRSQLGKGGMGEVYLAFDSKMNRNIAIKVLPKDGADQTRLRRFKREAFSASSLNHPNIITVHDLGETGEIYYIVTELIEGITLRERLRTDIPAEEAIDICIQIGKALVAAHGAEIIHRDIKPENVMLASDGHVKVLDFGLAKVSAHGESLEKEGDSTVSVFETEPGAFIGTIGYMSPEQLRQEPVDVRTDIWSLGIVLFETLTGARPFAEDSASETIAAILKQRIPALSVTDPAAETQLNTVVQMALARARHERYASIRELVEDLIEVRRSVGPGCLVSSGQPQDEYQREAPVETDENRKPADTLPDPDGPRFSLFTERTWLTVLFLTIGIAGIILLYAFVFKSNTEGMPDPLEYKNRALSSAGNVVKAAVSPDGSRVVYVVENADGLQSMRVGDMNYLPSSSREMIPLKKTRYTGLTFSPDGNYIYYVVFEESNGKENTTGTLFRRLRESDSHAQEILNDVDSPVTFSPDGSKLAYIKRDWQRNCDVLMIADALGGDQRVLLEKKYPEFIATGAARESPAWSPDGESIACPIGGWDGDREFMTIAAVNVKSGKESVLTDRRWTRVGRVAWLPSGDQLLVSTADSVSDLYQIVVLFRHDGSVKPFTRDLCDYLEFSITPDARKVVTIQSEKKAGLWVAKSSDPGKPDRLTAYSYDALWGGAWQDNAHLIYSSFENGARDLWQIGIQNGERRRITFDQETNENPALSPDGKYVVFTSDRNTKGTGRSASHVWRADLGGAGPRQMTTGEGEYFPQVTSDGKWLIYAAGTGMKSLFKKPFEGGDSVLLVKSANWPAVSPDGETIAALTIKEGDSQFSLGIFSVQAGALLKSFAVQGGIGSPTVPPILRWTRDGKNVTYTITKGNVSNLWMQPLNGEKANPVTDFASDTIFWFDWSGDGGQIAYSRGTINNNMVLFFWVS